MVSRISSIATTNLKIKMSAQYNSLKRKNNGNNYEHAEKRRKQNRGYKPYWNGNMNYNRMPEQFVPESFERVQNYAHSGAGAPYNQQQQYRNTNYNRPGFRPYNTCNRYYKGRTHEKPVEYNYSQNAQNNPNYDTNEFISLQPEPGSRQTPAEHTPFGSETAAEKDEDKSTLRQLQQLLEDTEKKINDTLKDIAVIKNDLYRNKDLLTREEYEKLVSLNKI